MSPFMELGLSFEVILFFALGLVLLYLLGWLLVAPFKFILKLLANGIIGGLVLFLINLAGRDIRSYHRHQPVDGVCRRGFWALPGVVLLLILKLICNQIYIISSCGMKRPVV